MNKKQKISITPIAVVILILMILFLIGFFFRWNNQRSLEKRAEANLLPVVRIMIAQPEKEAIPLTLPSFLVAYNVTPILARTNGYLKNFYVDIGDTVKKNQLLCEIETPDVDAEWVKAQAELEQTIAKEWIAKITAERWAKLYERDKDAVPKEEVDETQAAFNAAVADVEAAQANLLYWEVLKDFKYIRAPFDGIISERNIDIGSLISAGNESMTQPYTTGFEVLTQPLFKIISTEIFRAFVEVPQPFFPYIKDGVSAEVFVPEYPHEIFQGKIVRNANALDQESRTLLTQVNIQNKDNLLRAGLYTEVQFSFKPYEDTFTIPVGALIIRNGPPLVALLKDDNTAYLQEVQIGRDFGKSLQIIKGLKKDDKIILNPSYKIRNGVKVREATKN